MTRKRSIISEIRHDEYESAKILGDIQAVRHHRVKQRIERRLLGRLMSQVIRALVK